MIIADYEIIWLATSIIMECSLNMHDKTSS